MKKRGEITVFLCLVLVCILSLCMGLLESARTTGARLYGQIAAESAVSSVMTQYNRNLWDMYHLLFLEAESEEAIVQSFSKYMDFYCGQKNLYPMTLEEVRMTDGDYMMEKGGKWLEEGVLSYVKYRLPDVAEDLLGIVEKAEQAKNAGNFRELFQVCNDTGKKTRKLENCRMEIEESISDMRQYQEKLEDSVGRESEGQFEMYTNKLVKEIRQFSRFVDAYEKELEKVTEHLEDLRRKYASQSEVMDHMRQEITAYEQVEASAREMLLEYRNTEDILEKNLGRLDEALEILSEERYEYVYVGSVSSGSEGGSTGSSGVENNDANEDNTAGKEEDMYELVAIGPDWAAIEALVVRLEIPGEVSDQAVDKEKISMLNRLETLFQGNLLDLVLPEGTSISRKYVLLSGIPSKTRQPDKTVSGEAVEISRDKAILDTILINEYCFLSFDSFLEQCQRKRNLPDQKLHYEQEYLLCGESSDRENLAGTVEKLLTIRGSMNLLCLLKSPEKRGEADALALAVSGGYAPVKFVLSFFILALWAFGEAIPDVKCLLNGGSVPFWKQENQWNVSLEKLLSLEFLDIVPEKYDDKSNDDRGNDYKDHLRILFFLMKEEVRNYRMMDVIQWNVRTVQEDFAVKDCVKNVKLEADIQERHLFFTTNEYQRTIRTVGVY